MKVLFDTNVLVAAFLTHGSSNEVFEHCLSEHTTFTSGWILHELEETLSRKLRFPPAKVKKILRFIGENTQMVEPLPLNEKLCRDRDDDNVLAAALAGAADCIITGDKDLLVLKEFRGIQIISPAEFWEFEAKKR